MQQWIILKRTTKLGIVNMQRAPGSIKYYNHRQDTWWVLLRVRRRVEIYITDTRQCLAVMVRPVQGLLSSTHFKYRHLFHGNAMVVAVAEYNLCGWKNSHSEQLNIIGFKKFELIVVIWRHFCMYRQECSVWWIHIFMFLKYDGTEVITLLGTNIHDSMEFYAW